MKKVFILAFISTIIPLFAFSNTQAQWRERNSGLPGTRVEAIAASPLNPDLLACYVDTYGASDHELFFSADAGSTWTSPTEETFSIVKGILLSKHDENKVIVYGFGGVCVSTDGGQTWIPSDHSFRTFYDLAESNSDVSYLVAGTNEGVYESTDGGFSWQLIGLAGPSVYAVHIDSRDDNVIWAGCSSYGSTRTLFVTTDGGQTWNSIQYFGEWVKDIVSDPLNADKVFVSYIGGVAFTEDFGQTWQLSGAIGDLGYALTSAEKLVFCDVDPNVGFVCVGYRGVMATSDNANYWYHFGLNELFIEDLALRIDRERNEVELFAASTQTGVNSILLGITTDREPPIVSDLHVELENGEANILFTTNEPAIAQVEFGSTADLGYFTRLESSYSLNHSIILKGIVLGEILYYRLFCVDTVGNLATTDIFAFSSPVTGVEEEESRGALPSRCALLPNFPNPFNPSTVIRYSLRDEASVNLAVHDILGRKVKTLVDQVQGAGHYSTMWDGYDDSGRKVASGVYLCRLQAGEFSQTRKMVMVK